jgi:hypothetical protein
MIYFSLEVGKGKNTMPYKTLEDRKAYRKAYMKAYQKEYREKNKEKIRAQTKAWNEKNKEKVKAIQKAWTEKNKEKIDGYKKKYEENNKEKVRVRKQAWAEDNRERANAHKRAWSKRNPEYRKEWRQNNKDRINATVANRRALKFRATIRLTELDKFIIDEMYSLAILRSEQTGFEWHVDHIVPLSKGGLHKPTNLQVVPGSWNLSKNNKNCEVYNRIVQNGY